MFQFFNKLGITLQHVDFVWSLQVLITYITRCHCTTLHNFKVPKELACGHMGP
jgi:hypothetical protein